MPVTPFNRIERVVPIESAQWFDHFHVMAALLLVVYTTGCGNGDATDVEDRLVQPLQFDSFDAEYDA